MGKTLVKLLLLLGAIYLILNSLVQLLGLLQANPSDYLHLGLCLAPVLLFKLVLVLALIAFIDMAYTRWSYQNKLKMSHREIKDEHKSREGDPQSARASASCIKRLAKRAQAIKRLPDADVLITNPRI